MDSDLNWYNLHHRVSHHPRMSDGEWEEAYDAAWRSYYSPQHMETVARRHAAVKGRDPVKVVRYLTEFKVLYELEGVHPLEGGVIRLKYRTDRRPGLPVEWPVLFHLKLAAGALRKQWLYFKYIRQARDLVYSIRSDPARHAYRDLAITPAAEEEVDSLMLFTQTSGGVAAVERKRAEDRRRAIFSETRAQAS
jgi:hypothetical protein